MSKKATHGMPEAGSSADKVRLGGSSTALRRALEERDLGTGVADCGCVVMDYQFYPCPAHAEGGQPHAR